MQSGARNPPFAFPPNLHNGTRGLFLRHSRVGQRKESPALLTSVDTSQFGYSAIYIIAAGMADTNTGEYKVKWQFEILLEVSNHIHPTLPAHNVKL
jgi:hypothetical protein